MNKFLTILACMSMPVCLLAQKGDKIPDFGKVEKADLEMKECDFDDKADAVILFDIGELHANIQSVNGNMELERHIRIKILKDKGKDNADIHIPYYYSIENIKNLQAQTYNLDGAGNIVTTKVEKKLIYDKTIDKYYHEQIFTFPEVKAGSIIEYKWKQTWEGISLDEWYFQHDIPVKYSQYRVDCPREVEFSSTPFCVLPFESKKADKATRTIQTYVMKNIPALRDEPYISCNKDYLQRVQFTVTAYNLAAGRVNKVRSWPDVIKKLMEHDDFGVQLKRNIPRTSGLDSALKNITDPYRKMVIIHEYVRKNMEWNGLSNIWALNGVRAAWKEKKGTSGEINLILVNLLKDANLKAHAMLVSTREHGVVTSMIADVRQFNKVLAYVEIDDKVYVLDATEKTTPSYLIPRNVIYSEGLVIEKPETFEWGWKPLWSDKHLNKNMLMVAATIDDKGAMEGNASMYSFDYARVQRIEDARNDKDKFLEKYFRSNNQGASVDSLVLENLEVDSLPLIQKVHFNLPVSASGDYKYFSTNLFTSLEKNPFVADNRFSDVFFGTNQSFNLVANYTIPESYAFETLPKNMRMIMPDTSISITRRTAVQNNELSVRVTLEFSKPFFGVEEYPDFKEFYKQLFAILSEQIAIKKKG